MGIRVRKLARELRCTAGDVLGLLQQLGYERYRSPEDMVSDVVAAKIRSASATPVPAPQRGYDTARTAPPKASAPSDPQDVMAALVPGVIKKAPSVSARHPSEPTDFLEAERERLRALGSKLEAERLGLVAERAELDALRQRIVADQEALEAERAVPPHVAPDPVVVREGQSLLSAMEARGLRGTDEAERALAALAGARASGRHLEALLLADAAGWTQLLNERLVLVGGPEAPAGLETPHVVVSRERGDIPGARELARLLSSLGEQLMLSGWVRVGVVGLPAKWVAVVRRGMDPRISLTFRPSATAEITDEDAISVMLVWAHGASKAADGASEGAAARIFESRAPSLAGWLEEIRSALSQAD